MKLLEGKVILVTGAGNGIGRSHALSLAALGAKLVVNDLGTDVRGSGRSSEPAHATVADIIAAGGEALANVDDISSWAGARRAVHAGIDAFGKLDGVVNNAGNLRRQSLAELSEEDFDTTVAVHLKGSFACSAHACAYWKGRFDAGDDPRGAIVSTISDAMIVGLANSTIYSAVKAGIAQLTINGSGEAKAYGVRMNAYGPRAFTRMSSASYVNPGAPPDAGALHPKDPGNASPLVAWLLSDQALHVSGQIFQTIGGGIARCTPLAPGEVHWPPAGSVKFDQDAIGTIMNEKIFGTNFPRQLLQEPPGWSASFD